MIKKEDVKFGLEIQYGSEGRAFIIRLDSDGDIDHMIVGDEWVDEDWMVREDVVVLPKQDKPRIYQLPQINCDSPMNIAVINSRLHCISFGDVPVSKMRRDLINVLNCKAGAELVGWRGRCEGDNCRIGCKLLNAKVMQRVWNKASKDHKCIKKISKVKGIYQ